MTYQELSGQHPGELQQSYTEYVLGSESKQTNDTEQS